MEASIADPAVQSEAPEAPAPVEPEMAPEPDIPPAEPGSIELVTGKTINLRDVAPVVAALNGEGLPAPDAVLHLENPNGSPYNVRASAIIAYE